MTIKTQVTYTGLNTSITTPTIVTTIGRMGLQGPAGADATLPDTATQAEAEAGTETATRMWSPLRIFQAIAAWVAGQLGSAAYSDSADFDPSGTTATHAALSNPHSGSATSGANSDITSLSGLELVESHGIITATENFSAVKSYHSVTMESSQAFTFSGFSAAHPKIAIQLIITNGPIEIGLPANTNIIISSVFSDLSSVPIGAYYVEITSYDDGASYMLSIQSGIMTWLNWPLASALLTGFYTGTPTFSRNSVALYQRASDGLFMSSTIDTPRFQESRPLTVVVLGDSLVALPNVTPTMETLQGASATIINSGIAGDHLQDCIDRWETDVLAYNPDFVIIQPGINDVVDAPTSTLQEMIDDLDILLGLADTAGIIPIVCELTPFKNFPWWSSDRQTQVEGYNAYVKSLDRKIIRSYHAMEDPTNADELRVAYDSGDGLHYSAAGQVAFGRVLSKSFKSWSGAGVYLENPAVTIDCPYTTRFDVGWYRARVVLTESSVPSIISGQTVTHIASNSINNNHIIQNTEDVNLVLGETYTISVIAKQAELKYIGMFMFWPDLTRVKFDLSTCTIVEQEANADASIESLGDGWCRCIASAVCTATGAYRIGFFPMMEEAITSGGIHTGDNVSGIFVAHAQIEHGSYASSPVITSGTAMTRESDLLAIPVTGNIPENGPWHIRLYWTPRYIDTGAVRSCVFTSRLDDNNYVSVWLDFGGTTMTFEKLVSSVSEVATVTVTPVVGTTYKLDAYVNADGTINFAVDDVADTVNDSTTLTPVYGSTIEFGTFNAADPSDCNIRNVTINNAEFG